ncbi:MAG: alpha/beta hydrolase [Phycisphaerales bacterium]
MRLQTVYSALLVTLISLLSEAAQAAEPDMVRPETLSQGFVLIVKDNSGQANQDNPIYLASSMNGWNPSDPVSLLSGRSDTRWQIVIDKDLQGVGMQFKFTLGGWDREELDSDGNSIANRSLPLIDRSTLRENERPVIEIEIPQFRVPRALSEQVRESGIYRKLNVTGTVKRVEVRGGSGGAQASTRDLLVWLPEGYSDEENSLREYPVLYMFDGQNLFDQMPGVPGEWEVDETLTELIESGVVEPLIVVGIPHSGEHRIREFMPFGSYEGIDGDGAACMQWIIHEVMPKINRSFRVRESKESTAIGGASLGGAMALYGAGTYHNVFGKALIESLPMLGRDSVIDFIQGLDSGIGHFVLGMGTSEVGTDPSDTNRNAEYIQWAKEVERALVRKDTSGNVEHKLLIGQDDVHNEQAWASRFADAVRFMFLAN